MWLMKFHHVVDAFRPCTRWTLIGHLLLTQVYLEVSLDRTPIIGHFLDKVEFALSKCPPQ